MRKIAVKQAAKSVTENWEQHVIQTLLVKQMNSEHYW
jgi:hypothetical protein